jgi:hypothetical protein
MRGKEKVKKYIVFIISAAIISAIITGCTRPSLEEPGQVSVTSNEPLSYLLRVVPATVDTIMFSDIPVLSASEGQSIPSRQASQEERVAWWTSFERQLLAVYSAPAIDELWGFRGVDIQGILNWPPLQTTVLGGMFDTTAFREKMKSYGYNEESYLDYIVISGKPKPIGDLTEQTAGMMPRAYGVIDGMKVDGDTVNLIIMSTQGAGEDVLRVKASVEAMLESYHDKTTLAYMGGGITDLASSLGNVGSAFITKRSDLEEIWQKMDAIQKDKLKKAIGPGELDPYKGFAITYYKEGESRLLEFVLAYDSAAAAEANTETLRTRLAEAHSILYGTLSEIWIVRHVTAEGPYLRATVELVSQEGGKAIYLAGMIYAPDYWFLLPGAANE